MEDTRIGRVSQEEPLFAATHVGRDHLRVGRNNQDGCFTAPGVVVVTDGCSSQPNSEVGAQLGARFLGQWLVAAPSRDRSHTPRLALDALLGWMKAAAESLGGPLEETLERFFLFTVLAAVKAPGGEVFVFGLGDGGFVVDDRVVRLDSGPDNAPQYPAYGLVGAKVEPELHFFGEATRVAVMTDGLNSVDPVRLRALVDAASESSNPLTLQRRLNVLAETERFLDDATLAVL